jgi:hypothetical protein
VRLITVTRQKIDIGGGCNAPDCDYGWIPDNESSLGKTIDADAETCHVTIHLNKFQSMAFRYCDKHMQEFITTVARDYEGL